MPGMYVMGSSDILPGFIVDSNGKRVAVVLDPDHNENLVRAREELADIQAYDRAKSQHDEVIPEEEAGRVIER